MADEFRLASSGIDHEGRLPRKYTDEGQGAKKNISPPLEWHNLPEGTKSLALLVEDIDAPDPDAPIVPWTCWVIVNIPPSLKGLPEGFSGKENELGGDLSEIKEGHNDMKVPGWHVPKLPSHGHGRHRLQFKLYALDHHHLHFGTKLVAEPFPAMADPGETASGATTPPPTNTSSSSIPPPTAAVLTNISSSSAQTATGTLPSYSTIPLTTGTFPTFGSTSYIRSPVPNFSSYMQPNPERTSFTSSLLQNPISQVPFPPSMNTVAPFNGSLNQACTIKLDRSNYLLWKSTILPIVRGHKLDGHLLGTKPKPPEVVSTYNPATMSALTVPNPAYEDWYTKDQLLVGWLMSSMKEEALLEVVGSETKNEIWTSLEILYNNRSEARMLEYKTALTRSEKGSKPMMDYLAQMKSYSDGLAAAGYPITKGEFILATLGGLSKEYESVIVNLTSRIGSLSWQEVQSQLVTHERLLARFNPSANLDMGFPSANVAVSRSNGYRQSGNRSGNQTTQDSGSGRGRGNRGGRNSRGRGGRGPGNGNGNGNNSGNNRPICQVCNKTGHTTVDCWHRFDSNVGTPSQSGSSQRNNNAYLASSDTVNVSNWYMDSGASSHVTADLNNLHINSGYEGSDSLTVGNRQILRDGAAGR